MTISTIHLLYFSPTGTTKQTLLNISKGFKDKTIVSHDMTDFKTRYQNVEFSKDDLVIIGLPVYEGHLVCTSEEILNHIKGSQTLCVPVVTYGNRAYDVALYELVEKMKQRDFIPLAAATTIGEHSFSHEIATNRPDESDALSHVSFGEQLQSLLQEDYDNLATRVLEVAAPPVSPTPKDIPVCPSVSEACQSCKACVKKCPMQAIDPHEPKRTDNFRCILCMRCVKECPKQARFMALKEFEGSVEVLKFVCALRQEAEYFFSV